MSDEGNEQNTSSNYPFYVNLDSAEGLILGQHVYIETNVNEDESGEPSGPMIPMYYLDYEDNGDAFVWAAGSGDKLEKRTVTLGAFDDMMGTYEIVDGLELTDYIAFPEEGLEEGRPGEKFDPSSFSDGGSMEAEAIMIG